MKRRKSHHHTQQTRMSKGNEENQKKKEKNEMKQKTKNLRTIARYLDILVRFRLFGHTHTQMLASTIKWEKQ